jgi:hypothetical protein
MNYFMNQFLKESRKRLNRIIIAIYLVKITGWTGAASALLIVAARFFGWTGTAWGIWLILTGIGAVTGLVTGWRHRLNVGAVARWVDEYQKNDEAYSAALVCLNRNCSEPLDDLVVDRAEAMACNPSVIRWPTRYLFRWTAITVGLLLGATAVFLWNPPPSWNLSRYIISKHTVDNTNGNPIGNIDRLELRQLATKLAKQFFPKDAKRAMEFQKALESGDINQLEEIFKQSRLGFEARMAQEQSPSEQQHLLDEERRIVSQMQSLLEKIKKQKQNRTGSEETNDTVGNKSSRLANRNNQNGHNLKPESTRRKKRVSSSAPESQRTFFRYVWKNLNPGGKLENTKNGTLYKGGTDPGQEPGNKQGKWSITARPGQKPIVNRKQETPEMEYVLPGKNATMPLSQVLPDFQRSAEAALTRNGVPAEYDDFVRNYFLELSREIKGGSPESEGQK